MELGHEVVGMNHHLWAKKSKKKKGAKKAEEEPERTGQVSITGGSCHKYNFWHDKKFCHDKHICWNKKHVFCHDKYLS